MHSSHFQVYSHSSYDGTGLFQSGLRAYSYAEQEKLCPDTLPNITNGVWTQTTDIVFIRTALLPLE